MIVLSKLHYGHEDENWGVLQVFVGEQGDAAI